MTTFLCMCALCTDDDDDDCVMVVAQCICYTVFRLIPVDGFFFLDTFYIRSFLKRFRCSVAGFNTIELHVLFVCYKLRVCRTPLRRAFVCICGLQKKKIK